MFLHVLRERVLYFSERKHIHTYTFTRTHTRIFSKKR